MPDLNTANPIVQGYIRDFLIEMIDCGVDGFRFDAAKHIETPEDDPAFASDFWPNVLDPARAEYARVTGKSGSDLYVYGEILNTVGDNFDIANYTKRMSVTDNSCSDHFFDSVRYGQAGNFGYQYDRKVSLLWAESHDTYMNTSSSYGSDTDIVRAWSMIANQDDAAKLFYVRPYTSDQILQNGQSGSMKGNDEIAAIPAAVMGECPTYVWASKEVAAINHLNNRYSNSASNYGSNGNVMYTTRGNGIVLASFGGAGSVSVGGTGLASGTYTDEVSGNTFTCNGGTVSGNIGSSYGMVFG